MKKKNEITKTVGGYMAVDRLEALKKNWPAIQKLIKLDNLPSSHNLYERVTKTRLQLVNHG